MKEVEELYGLYGRSIYAYLLRLSGSHELAAECTQETFLRLLTALRSYRGDARVQTWLYGVARNVYRDEMRRRSKSDQTVSGLVVEGFVQIGVDPLGHIIEGENRSEVNSVLWALPESYREVLVLKEFDALPYGDIASIMGKSINWVRVTYFRARAKFRELFNKRRENGDA